MGEIVDSNGKPINIGDPIQRISDGLIGKVIDILKPEKHKTKPVYMPIYFGDIVVRTDENCTTFSSNYSDWIVLNDDTGITLKERELLQHMLGADSRYMKKQWGFRNYFCASEGHSDLPYLKEMEEKGLVKLRRRLGNEIYFATKKGALAIGFKPYQLRKTKLAA